MTSTTAQSSFGRRVPALIMLSLVWVVSVAVLASPLVETLALKALFLGVPMVLSALVTVAQPQEGFTLWAFGLVLLVTQTGFQLDVGPIRTSALELGILFLLLTFVFVRRRQEQLAALRIPGQTIFFLFAAYALLLLPFTLIQGGALGAALSQLKGFLLYPLIAYILLAGIRSRRALRWLMILLIVWYLFWAGAGILQFITGAGPVGDGPFIRASGGYAPINLFGITLAGVALFLVGFGEYTAQSFLRLMARVLAALLFLAAVTSLARTIWIAFAIAILFIATLAGSRKRVLALWLLIAVGITFATVSEQALDLRVLQLTDSSTQQRSYYLFSGLNAWKAHFLTGWGWGRSLWYTGSIHGQLPWSQLFSLDAAPLALANRIPWYHNDYLNLAVQSGGIGLGLYLAFWQRVLAAGRRWLAQRADSPLRPYVAGSLAALVGLLAAALFEHVLWRPDIAGLLGLFLGVLLVAMRLGAPAEEATAP